MSTRSVLFLAALIVVALVAPAQARHVKFLGAHPVASRYGGGYCYIESPHLHIYAPDHQALFQQVGDQWVFTGDPTPFGYEGERHTFYGHHPVVTVGTEPVYCYLNGPHFHAFAAPPLPEYKVDHDVAFYVGPFPPAYVRVKRERMHVVNAEYRPFVSFRPLVQVQPPPEWQGEVYVAPPSVSVQAPGAAVHVGAPGVVIGVPPPPSVSVEISAPGVYVAPPPPPRVGVRVGMPGVVVGAPPGVVVVPGGRRWEHGDGEHEGGEHEGGERGDRRGWRGHGEGEHRGGGGGHGDHEGGGEHRGGGRGNHGDD